MFLVVCSIHKQGAGLNESERALEKLWGMSSDGQSILMTLITKLGGETSTQVDACMSGSSRLKKICLWPSAFTKLTT